jgi:hypothetical protein
MVTIMDKEIRMEMHQIEKVNQNYKQNPEYFRTEFKESILNKKVLLGMWPTEALLAGGGGSYRVKADEKVWPVNTNPMQIIQAQSLKPDNSHIEIGFYNDHQFDKEIACKFRATFEQGICIDIKEIENA